MVDGANLTPDMKNRVQRQVRIGSHVLEVPSLVYIDETTRVTFDGWSDGDKANPRTIVLNENATLTATYKLQNLLQVSSPYGSPTGSGWYDASGIATFSIANIVDQGNGTRRVFSSWRGDSNASSTTSQIDMSKPRCVFADWRTQYAIEFTSTGLDNGTRVNLTINGKSENHTVPFNHIEWFDKGSECSFQVSPESVTAGIARYKLERWIEKYGKNVTSPLTATQPDKLTAVYSLKGPFKTPSTRTLSSVARKFWTTYLETISNTFDFLSREPKLLQIFIVIAYPFLAVMDFAHKLYLTFSFASVFSTAGAVIVAGILLGLIYLFPISIVILGIYRWKRKKVPRMRILLPASALWILGTAFLVVGIIVATPATETIGAAGFGVLGIDVALLSGLIPSSKIIGLFEPKKVVLPPKKTVSD
jgi:hypothetical protein